jgi:hypothetical protein
MSHFVDDIGGKNLGPEGQKAREEDEARRRRESSAFWDGGDTELHGERGGP